MDKFIKTATGGLPLKLDDILWEKGELDASNYGIYQALQAGFLAFGTDFIVQGCTYSAPNITAGWIMLDGELLRVDAHAGTDNYFSKDVSYDSRGDKTFKDLSSVSTYQVNRGVLDAASGSLNILTANRYEDLVQGNIVTKVFDLGDWNMDASQVLQINVTTLGLDFTKIRGLRASIRGDVGSVYEEYLFNLGVYQSSIAGYVYLQEITGDNVITLVRTTSGFFDSTDFDATSYNRGWLMVDYIL